MSKSLLILIACFCLALAAGAAVGIVLDRFALRPHRRPPIVERLDLTAKQSEQMRAIWAPLSGPARWQGEREKREELRNKRDKAIRDLLNKEQSAKYGEVMKAYTQAATALEAEGRKAIDEAVEKTKTILTPEQRKTYEQIMKEGPRFAGRRGGPGRRAPEFGGPPPGGPEKGGPQAEPTKHGAGQ